MRARYLALGEGVAPTPNGGTCRDGKGAFGESQGGLSAHLRREDPMKLSAKAASPVGRQRVTFAESFLSAKASTRGKGPSPRGSPLSAKAPNPVVWQGNIELRTTLPLRAGSERARSSAKETGNT
jgi:hypothetical protein